MPRKILVADLLIALKVLKRDRKSLVECCSKLREVDGHWEAIPGTLEPDAKDDVAEYDMAIGAVSEAMKALERRKPAQQEEREVA